MLVCLGGSEDVRLPQQVLTRFQETAGHPLPRAVIGALQAFSEDISHAIVRWQLLRQTSGPANECNGRSDGGLLDGSAQHLICCPMPRATKGRVERFGGGISTRHVAPHSGEPSLDDKFEYPYFLRTYGGYGLVYSVGSLPEREPQSSNDHMTETFVCSCPDEFVP
eukprot:6044529-Amphidinium_carterae.1